MSAPTRWHYSGSPESADVLVVAQSGTELCGNCGEEAANAVVSGYEYQDQHMQTIFYAQGPSIQRAVTIPPFQNVELMNLWIELLKMEHVPNNGSVAFVRQILWKSKPRFERRKFGI
ncbi:hypothetical protein OSTOST_13038, partial [Ostertagia ostertagi]